MNHSDSCECFIILDKIIIEKKKKIVAIEFRSSCDTDSLTKPGK